MDRRFSFFLTVFITAVITAILYRPASLAIFRISEPYFGCPIKPSDSGKLVIRNDALGDGDYGTKRSGGRTHTGMDIQAAVSTPVYASKSGTAFCGVMRTGYGKYIIIFHPDGTQTMYAHLSNWAIPRVKDVRKGEIIGFVGKTGNAANRLIASHLHFEIRKEGEPVDPRHLMR